MRGFEFRETMVGTYSQGQSAPQDLEFTVKISTANILDYLRTGYLAVEGQLHAEGLAADAPVHGTMVMPPLGRMIRYDLRFTSDEGKDCWLRGQKDIRLTNMLGSLTILPGALSSAEGVEFATCEVRFPVRQQLLSFLRSWRLY